MLLPNNILFHVSIIFDCLVLAGLQKLASRVSSEQDKNKSKKLMVRDCVQYLTQCHEHVLDLTSACTLVDLIRAVVHHTDNNANLATGIGESSFTL